MIYSQSSQWLADNFIVQYIVKMKSIQIQVSEIEKKKLEEYCKKYERTKSDVIRELIGKLPE